MHFSRSALNPCLGHLYNALIDAHPSAVHHRTDKRKRSSAVASSPSIMMSGMMTGRGNSSPDRDFRPASCEGSAHKETSGIKPRESPLASAMPNETKSLVCSSVASQSQRFSGQPGKESPAPPDLNSRSVVSMPSRFVVPHCPSSWAATPCIGSHGAISPAPS